MRNLRKNQSLALGFQSEPPPRRLNCPRSLEIASLLGETGLAEAFLKLNLIARQAPRFPRAAFRDLECPLNVCAVRRRRFPVGASPTRQPLQPEATGAARACVARELSELVAEGAVTAVLVTHDLARRSRRRRGGSF